MTVPVGASLLAMVVNDNAALQDKRGALEYIASKLAPTDRWFDRTNSSISIIFSGTPVLEPL
ncbi:hypothetical protein CES87_09755 [Pseudomonas sp. ERMR1:02]|nr:hypothetical protein CES87_09755 [Pseudomonas sp. ERMR1:02]